MGTVGGVPRGLITEIYGNEGSGKTTLSYHLMAETQKAGGTAAYIDAEQRMDPSYAQAVPQSRLLQQRRPPLPRRP